jgi:hypothetical protein
MAVEYIPAGLLDGVRPGDWIETAKPPRQVAEVLRYRIRFTDGTELRKAAS